MQKKKNCSFMNQLSGAELPFKYIKNNFDHNCSEMLKKYRLNINLSCKLKYMFFFKFYFLTKKSTRDKSNEFDEINTSVLFYRTCVNLIMHTKSLKDQMKIFVLL